MTIFFTWLFAELATIYSFCSEYWVLSFPIVISLLSLVISVFVSLQGRNK